MMEFSSRVDAILSFWFGTPQDNAEYYDTRSKLWFTPAPTIDQEITHRFSTDYQRAAERQLQSWQERPRSALALLLLLDQFPRNMFRGAPQAFATDALAREVTASLLATGGDRQLCAVERMFVYLPLMHSEDLAQQQQSVMLFRQLAQDNPRVNSVSYAERHQEIIGRFGRFPHRNTILGRPSTPEESEFLKQPSSSF